MFAARPRLGLIAVLAYRQDGKGELLADSLVRLDDKLQADGTLNWSAPAGKWRVFRFAYAPNFMPMKQDSPGFTGLQIDHMSAPIMELFFNKVGVPLLEAAGPHVGKTLDFLHEDSVELGHFDWTGDFPAQFAARRKYDLLPWLPVLAGKKFAGQSQAGRVENDFVATVDELLADEHYGTFLKLCHQHGLKLQTEGGDVFSSLRVKGMTDLPMGEFWNARPTKTDARYVENSNYLRAFNPNAVIASHVYGANRVSFESFTTAQHWLEHPAMLKPMADEVYCLGVNHLTLHGYSYSRPETPPPGDVYFAGTHFDPGITWWKYAGEFFAYLNRCQALLLAGRPVVDVLYVDGPETQALLKWNEARTQTTLGKCDVISGELLAAQLSVLPGGRVGLANGASYSVLAVANAAIEPEALQKIVQLANAGTTVWLRAVPQQSLGWQDCAEADKAIARCLNELGADQPAGVHAVGKGKVVIGEMPVKDMLARLDLAPAFAYTADDGQACLDYNQRQDGDAEIYFVANWREAAHRADCVFRVVGKQPELWNPVTGGIAPCAVYTCKDGVTRLALQLPPNGSTFVVFRKPGVGGAEKIAEEKAVVSSEVTGPWHIQFSPARTNVPPFEITASKLFLWNESAEGRLKSFAGTAIYQTTFVFNPKSEIPHPKLSLDLGEIHDLAEVFVNGKSVGVVWTPPFQVDVAPVLRAGTNALEIHVVNTWHNWRVAMRFVPLQHPWAARGLALPLMPGGLLGPVTLRTEQP